MATSVNSSRLVTAMAAEAQIVGNCDGDDPLSRMVRMANGQFTPEDRQALQRAFTAYIESDGGLSLERCLHVPTTWKAWRRMKRNYWLCQAAQHIDATGVWTGCVSLENEWEAFISRGPWRQWRDDARPPEDASQLSAALFWASRNNQGQALVARQLSRFVRHIFEAKCQGQTPSL